MFDRSSSGPDGFEQLRCRLACLATLPSCCHSFQPFASSHDVLEKFPIYVLFGWVECEFDGLHEIGKGICRTKSSSSSDVCRICRRNTTAAISIRLEVDFVIEDRTSDFDEIAVD